MQVGGGGKVEFVTEKKISLRNVPGVLKRVFIPYLFFGGGGGGILGCLGRPTRGVGKRYTSSYDHDM